MDKKKIDALKRHELLAINTAGRKDIFTRLQGKLSHEELVLAEFTLCKENNRRYIPAIIRRAEEYSGEQIPCGFVYPYLIEGRRWRLGDFVEPSNVELVFTPYEIIQMPLNINNSKLSGILSQIIYVASTMNLTVGVLGSLALEIYTGFAYTHTNSDIDLLITDIEWDELKLFCEQINSLARQEKIKIDLEVELTNGYGVKAQELFMNTRTVLAKGKKDVILLNKEDVLRVLK